MTSFKSLREIEKHAASSSAYFDQLVNLDDGQWSDFIHQKRIEAVESNQFHRPDWETMFLRNHYLKLYRKFIRALKRTEIPRNASDDVVDRFAFPENYSDIYKLLCLFVLTFQDFELEDVAFKRKFLIPSETASVCWEPMIYLIKDHYIQNGRGQPAFLSLDRVMRDAISYSRVKAARQGFTLKRRREQDDDESDDAEYFDESDDDSDSDDHVSDEDDPGVDADEVGDLRHDVSADEWEDMEEDADQDEDDAKVAEEHESTGPDEKVAMKHCSRDRSPPHKKRATGFTFDLPTRPKSAWGP